MNTIKKMMIFMLAALCALLGGCEKKTGDRIAGEAGVSSPDKEFAEIQREQIPDFKGSLGFMTAQSGTWYILGTKADDYSQLAIYTTKDSGKNYKEEPTNTINQALGLDENAMLLTADRFEDGGVVLAYKVMEGEGSGQHLAYIKADGTVKEAEMAKEQSVKSVRASYDQQSYYLNTGGMLLEFGLDGKLKQQISQSNILDFCEMGEAMAVLGTEELCTYSLSDAKLQQTYTTLSENLPEQLEIAQTRVNGVIGMCSRIMKAVDKKSVYLMLSDGIYRYTLGSNLLEYVVSDTHTQFQNQDTMMVDFNVESDTVFHTLVMLDSGTAVNRYAYGEEPATTEMAASSGSADSISVERETVENLKGEITIYMLRPADYMDSVVQAYQSVRPNVTVNMEVGIDEDSNTTVDEAVNKLNTELLSGTGPDVIVLDGLNVNTYSKNGMLADISDIYSKISADNPSCAQKIIGAYKTGKSVYAIPSRFYAAGLLGYEKDIQKITSLDALAEYVSDNEPAIDNALSIFTKEELYASVYPAYSAKILSADNQYSAEAMQEFLTGYKKVWQALMEQTSEDELQQNEENTEHFPYYEWEMRSVEGLWVPEATKQKVAFSVITRPLRTVELAAIMERNQDYVLDGGSMGVSNTFVPKYVVGLSSKSDAADLAKDFIKEMFTVAEQTGSEMDYPQGLPVNLDAYAYYCETLPPDTLLGGVVDGVNTSYHFEVAPEYRNRFKEYFMTMENPANMNEMIEEMIFEKLDAYLNDEISIEDYMDGINSKMNLYLSE